MRYDDYEKRHYDNRGYHKRARKTSGLLKVAVGVAVLITSLGVAAGGYFLYDNFTNGSDNHQTRHFVHYPQPNERTGLLDDKAKPVNDVTPVTEKQIISDIVVSEKDINIVVKGGSGSGRIDIFALLPTFPEHLEIHFEGETYGLANGDVITYTLTAKPGYTINGKAEETFAYTVSGLAKSQYDLREVWWRLDGVNGQTDTTLGALVKALPEQVEYDKDSTYVIDEKKFEKVHNGDLIHIPIRGKDGIALINGENTYILPVYVVGLDAYDYKYDQDFKDVQVRITDRRWTKEGYTFTNQSVSGLPRGVRVRGYFRRSNLKNGDVVKIPLIADNERNFTIEGGWKGDLLYTITGLEE